MTSRIPTYVFATDPITAAGISSQLRQSPEILVVDAEDLDNAQVALIVVEDIDQDSTRVIRAIQRNGVPRVVVVATRTEDAGLLAAIEVGVSGILRRADATPPRLVAAVRAAAEGDGTLPPDLLGRLLEQVGRLQRRVLAPRGIMLNGFTEREVSVLRLLADGSDTAEIAKTLCYSERTVKNVIHDVTSRHQLRNRSHAVAYAVRQGVI
ncbi:MAG TPA: LuxR C-terminal-related transcriptional regulator [Acidimicrobiales bacterium]|nr:LuxR C-terminal-related transcriptional regulator [Acidimicrobiales bacterium]